ncbi:DUF6308 family protein [Micromonospora phytophila]|uniref:DUF6308 family protein n=1 Tax=Micromonospora phytophila TaxID=709888 RepID=UPI00203020FA|nr:DUF6308 family protein [Micromonospora phytophila]MCM0673216.1 DUF6308 family protein [Micromonospora phytophila]
MTPEVPPIQVAGRIIEDPLIPFTAYCQRNGGTIRNYDWLAGSSSVLTPQLIKATRSPWMGSRISRTQELHLLDLSETAPWSDVAGDAHLKDAEPVEAEGLYARAVRLYQHFYHPRVRGIAVAKVSKSLYLMRPALFPILDSRLLNLYRESAEQAARDLGWLQGRQAPPRRAYWAAYRLDVVRARDGLAILREVAGRHQDPLVVVAASRLTDVRIMDILAWSLDQP